MRPDWLWDRNIPEEELKDILKDPQHERFVEIAALLLSRNNVPKDIFSQYLDRKVFVQNWRRIKRQMRKNKWNDSRIIFWKAIYEKLFSDYKLKGVEVFERKIEKRNIGLSRDVGQKIRNLREEEKLSQKELAQKMGISQQMISRIETGRENLCFSSLEKIITALGRSISLDFPVPPGR